MLVLPVSILFIAAALRLIDFAGVKHAKSEERPAKTSFPGAGTQAMTQPGSAYSLDKREEKSETHTLTVLVDNEPGVLARVIGLFSGRGYNIDLLTVSETEHEAHLSRITIVTSGPPLVIEQIQHQLERLVPIHSVTDLTVMGKPARARTRHGQGGRQGRQARRGEKAGRELPARKSSTTRPGISSSRSPASNRGSSNSSPSCSRSAWSRLPAPGLPPSRAGLSGCSRHTLVF